jgi:hypothetical protein
MLNKLYEWCYTEQELMLVGTEKPTFINRLKFRIVSILANKY